MPQIQNVTETPGSWQSPFQHMAPTLKKVGGDWIATARDKDIQDMKKFPKNPRAGSYQKWSEEILKVNGVKVA